MRCFGERYASEDRMSDERTAEPGPGTPGQRALGAMESAVRRARESAGAPPLRPLPSPNAQSSTTPVDMTPLRDDVRVLPPPASSPPPARPQGPAPASRRAFPRRAPEEGPARPRSDRWLVSTVVVVAALLVAAATALIVSLTGSSAPSSSTTAPSVRATTVPSHPPQTHPGAVAPPPRPPPRHRRRLPPRQPCPPPPPALR